MELPEPRIAWNIAKLCWVVAALTAAAAIGVFDPPTVGLAFSMGWIAIGFLAYICDLLTDYS